ncbi:DNA-methyltransferase Dcm [Mesorhizobium plurifarium]|uniref:Cytosine-specific methyltransferase n=1 Tax=Mesorhizobium plurifarium TaxID=69974 RepID=A0A090G039_MESPL|nr:DNA-methyltransferase Dcm [Mesorhizobium plurifarium]
MRRWGNDVLKALSLFTGIGGLDFGFEAAGFQTVAAVESDTTVVSTIRQNRKWDVLQERLDPRRAVQVCSSGIVESAGPIDIVIAGPPCQPFSKAAYWREDGASGLDDPRSNTLSAFLRVIALKRPRAFLLENVPGFAAPGHSGGLDRILRGVSRINNATGSKYEVHWAKLNAADYGVPQIRERVFLVAAEDGRPFKFPEPTHRSGSKLEQGASLPLYTTCWDALGHIAEPADKTLEMKGKWAALLPSIPEGENYLWHTSKGGGLPLFGWRTRYWTFLLKLAKDRPSWTIQSQSGSASGPFHWSNRRLSATELFRLQTFPEDVGCAAGRTEMQRMVGNAVPSLLAEVLAREVKQQLLDVKVNMNKPLKLAVAKSETVPRRAPARPVPDEYHNLIGTHPDHPGPGLGPGAAAGARAKRDELRKLKAA